MKQVVKDGSNYVPQGDAPLTPWDLLDMHQLCISKNNIGYLEFWVMTLLACHLFLREDELSNLTSDSIVWDATTVSASGEVKSLLSRFTASLTHVLLLSCFTHSQTIQSPAL